MRISKIQLRNGYKRFHNLTIDLGTDPKRIIALVGPNGCGKSSVLDGILYHCNGHQKIGGKDVKNYKYHSMNQDMRMGHTNILIEFREGSFESVRNPRTTNGNANTLVSFRSSYRYNSDLDVKALKATTEIKLNNYGATTSSDIDSKMEENYRRLYVKYNTYLNETDCKPSEAKSHIIEELNESIRNCLDLEIVSIGSIESSEGTLYFTKADHPSRFEFDVLSSGEKEVVDILLDLYLRKEEYADTVFLIDEPELHLNTSIQRKLLVEINKLIGQECQIWLTTHSIGFLRALQDDLNEECQVIYFKKDTRWASEPVVLQPIRKSLANWKEIFETALEDLTGLVSPKRIGYCEGKAQPGTDGTEKGLDARVYNNIFSEQFNDTLFVSSGGNTELDQRSEIAISILSKALSDLEILVLKDRDISSGSLTTEADRQHYLSTNLAHHRVLKRREVENYLYDSEVLEKYCALNGFTFDKAAYDAFVTNIFDQNIKDHTSRIKSICGITTSLNQEIFKLKLSEVITPDMYVFRELKDVIFERG